jgi:hypothetical protein
MYGNLIDVDGLWIVYKREPSTYTIYCSLFNSTCTTKAGYSDNLPTIDIAVDRHNQEVLSTQPQAYMYNILGAANGMSTGFTLDM